VRSRRDADALRTKPPGHPVLRGRRPGIVVLAVQDQDRRAAEVGKCRDLVGAAEQVLAHGDQALGGVAQHALAQERDNRRGYPVGDGLRPQLGFPEFDDSLGAPGWPGFAQLSQHCPEQDRSLAAKAAWS